METARGKLLCEDLMTKGVAGVGLGGRSQRERIYVCVCVCVCVCVYHDAQELIVHSRELETCLNE